MCREHRHIIFTLTSLLLLIPLDEKGEWLEHNYVGKGKWSGNAATSENISVNFDSLRNPQEAGIPCIECEILQERAWLRQCFYCLFIDQYMGALAYTYAY